MPALGAPLDVAPPRPAPQTTSRARQHGAQPIVERRRQSAAVTAAAGRASVGGAKKKSPQNPLRGVPLKQALALQLGGDARNLIGWRVIEQQDSRPVGVVDEVLSFDDGGNVQQTYLKVIDEPAVSHLIPLVPDIVTGVHLRTKQVMLDAPEGLLDLGSVTAIIDELRQELEQYSGAPAGSTAEKMGIKCLPGAKQLENVGRGDLVALIRKAGGFAEVAYRLGWKPHRKPPGYWEDVKMLDQELTYFIAGSWLEEKNQEGEIVYRNQATKRVSLDMPELPEMIPLDDTGTTIFVENEEDRVMPSETVVKAARRYDLHHAIKYHGGYKAVGNELGRPCVYNSRAEIEDFNALKLEIRGFMDKHQLTSIPRKGWLMQCGRRDIVHAIYREGGFSSVAARMGVDMNRKKHRQWGSMQEVVEELKAFMDASGSKDKGEAAHLPTRAQLEGAGRADLAYAVQKYGHCALSELAGMEPRKVGTHNRA